jgi:COMPASS component SPP1
VELMDVFVCPNCAASKFTHHQPMDLDSYSTPLDPAVSKTTTWKPRCLNGLSSANPSSKDACHKPKRSDGSKFCSDTCGMEYMSARIDGWVSCGGDRAHLWESVKGAPRREGFVAVVPLAPEGEQIVEIVPQGPDQTLEQSYKSSDAARAVVQPAHDRVQREVDRLESQISGWKERQLEQQQELKIVSWRIQLLARASHRADAVGECGWDQRLCYGDEEWLEFGEGVLESYDVEQGGADQDHADEFGQWWCPAPKKCNRHAGWVFLHLSWCC